MFYHCSDWAGLEHKSCGSLFFHPQKRVCDWPYIVKRIRPECEGDNLQRFQLEIVKTVDTPEEALETLPGAPTNDGSYVRFKPEPHNRFRFPTEPPRRPTKASAVVVEDENVPPPHLRGAVPQTSLARKPLVKVLRKPKNFRPVTTGDIDQGEFIIDSAEIVEDSDEELSPSPHVVLIKKESSEDETTTSSSTPPLERQLNRQRQPVVKTLPSRSGIVKSLPVVPAHSTRVVGGGAFSSVHPNHRSRVPINPSRTVVNRKPVVTRRIPEPEPVFVPGEFEEDRRPKAADVSSNPVEQIFDQAKKKQEDLERLKIQLLLEAAKVEPDSNEEETTLSAEEEDFETTTPTSDEDEDEEDVVTRKPESPFKTEDQRPEFLPIIQKKAEIFKEQLEKEAEAAEAAKAAKLAELAELLEEAVTTIDPMDVESEDENEEEDESNLEISIRRVTSTSVSPVRIVTSVHSSVGTSPPTTQPATLEEDEEQLDLDEDDEEKLVDLVILSPIETTTKVIEEEEVLEDNVDIIDGVTIVKPSIVTAKPVGKDEDSGKVVEPVYVVEAVPLSPNAQPLVSVENNFADESQETEDESAVQESRVHTTVALTAPDIVEQVTERKVEVVVDETTTMTTAPFSIEEVEESVEESVDEVEEHDHTEHPTSFQMLQSVMNHFNIEALFNFLTGESNDKEEEKEEETTQKVETTLQSESTVPEVKLVPVTTPKKQIVPVVEETTQVDTTTEEEEEEEVAIELATTTLSPQDEDEDSTDNVQIVLPVGWVQPPPSFKASTTTRKPITTTARRFIKTTRASRAHPFSKKYATIIRNTTPATVFEDDEDDEATTVSNVEEETTLGRVQIETTTPKPTTRRPTVKLVRPGITLKSEDSNSKRRELIRQRLRKPKGSTASALSVLKAIEAKEAKAREVEKERRLRLRLSGKLPVEEVTKKPLRVKIVKVEDNNNKPTNTEEEKVEDEIDDTKLAMLRKQLFLNRARNTSPLLTKSTVAEEIKRKNPTFLETDGSGVARTKPPALKRFKDLQAAASSGSTSSAPTTSRIQRLINLRRSRTEANNPRRGRGQVSREAQDDETDSSRPSAVDVTASKLRSLRCRLLRGAC